MNTLLATWVVLSIGCRCCSGCSCCSTPTGWLVLRRGAMDLLDGVAMILSDGGVKGPELFPLITAVFSFAVGVAFLRAGQNAAPRQA